MASGDKIRDAVDQWIGSGDWVAYCRTFSSSLIIKRRQIDEVFVDTREITFKDQASNKKRRAKGYKCILICDQDGDHLQ